eukprot:460959_1
MHLVIFSIICIWICNAQLDWKGTVECNQQVDGNIDTVNGTALYAFNNDYGSIDLFIDLCTTNFDTVVWLIDYNLYFWENVFEVYAFNDTGGECANDGSQLFYPDLPSNQIYGIVITGYSGETGQFTMFITCPTDIQPNNTIQCGETVSASLEPTETQYFSFDLVESANYLDIIVNGLQVAIHMFDGDFNELNANNSGSVTFTNDFIRVQMSVGPLSNGNYTIGVENWQQTNGAYSLNVLCIDNDMNISRIYCGDTVKSELSDIQSKVFYSFKNEDNSGIFITTDISGLSHFSSEIKIYDEKYNVLATEILNGILEYGPLFNGNYFISVESLDEDYGNFSMKLYCTRTKYFISKDGIDTNTCGDVSNPCGTMYYTSYLMKQNKGIDPIEIYLIDGQNETEIMQYLINNNTNNYDPCLPMPFNYNEFTSRAVNITFNAGRINEMNQWLPRNICSHTIEKVYNNKYLFDGAVQLTINNLIINNYSITDENNYPFMHVITEIAGASMQCNNCVFKNIHATVSPLIIASSNMQFYNTQFVNIDIYGAILYIYEWVEEPDQIIIDNALFENVKSDTSIIAISSSSIGMNALINNCIFRSISVNIAIIIDSTMSMDFSILNTDVHIIFGGFYLSQHTTLSIINFHNLSMTTSQIYSNSIDIFYFRIVDKINIQDTLFLYTYTVDNLCDIIVEEILSNTIKYVVCENPISIIQNQGDALLINVMIDIEFTIANMTHYEGLIFYYDESIISTSCIKNMGIMRILNMIIRTSISYHFIINQGTLLIDNLFTMNSEFDPNFLQSVHVIVQNGIMSNSVIKESVFNGGKITLNYNGGSAYILNTTFTNAIKAINYLHVEFLNIINSSFQNIGQYYQDNNRLNKQYSGSVIEIYSGNDILFENNHFIGFEPLGFVFIQQAQNVSILNNLYHIDTSDVYHDINVVVFHNSMVNIGDCIDTSVIGNAFTEIKKINKVYEREEWIFYFNNNGINCLSGNTFIGRALYVYMTDLTSCFRPKIGWCISNSANNTFESTTQCIYESSGDINFELIDTIGYFISETSISPEDSADYPITVWTDNSSVVLDNVHFVGSDGTKTYIHFIAGWSGQVLLVESIVETEIIYPSNYIQIVYNDRLLNNKQYTAALLFKYYSDNAVGFHADKMYYNLYIRNSVTWVQLSQSSEPNYVNHLLPYKLNFNPVSTLYYPGLLMTSFIGNITDRMDNAMSVGFDVELLLQGDRYLGEVTLDESGKCVQCEIFINSLSIRENIGQTYQLYSSVKNNKLLLNSNLISFEITGCPVGYGTDENNFICQRCEKDYFSLSSNNTQPCQSCEPENNPNVICSEGQVLVAENYWIGFDVSNKLISARCPVGYCCTNTVCNYFDDKHNLCSKNRDHESVLCSKCNDQYSVAMNNNSCTKCNRNHWEYLILPFLLSFSISVILMLTNMDPIKPVSPDKEISSDFKKMIKSEKFKLFIKISVLKNIMYYEQSINQILT